MSLVSLKEVGKSFGKKKILEKVNLEVQKGEIVGIVGPSGSGKSVLIKLLIGFLNPTFGKISFDLNPKVGFSMQNNSLYDYLTVKQNAKYFSKIYKVPKDHRKILLPKLINLLSLKDFERSLVKNLSGGTKKRVDLLCALINDPDVLILDEPFVGLDPFLVKSLSQFILGLNKSGKTIVISSHRTNELSYLASRIYLVRNKTLREINKSELEKAYL